MTTRAAALVIILAAGQLAPNVTHTRLVAQAQSSQGPARSGDSLPISVNGLEVVIRAARDLFVADEPLVMNVTFRNTSPAAFRAPDRLRSPQTLSWTLNVEEATTARRFTGVNLRPSGAAPQRGEITPVPLAPGEAQSSPVTFHMFGFIEGALGYQAARNAYFQKVVAGRGTPRGDEIVRLTGRGRAVPQEFHLPPGTYNVSVDVEFPRFLDRPNLPKDIQAEKDRLERDPVPIWNGAAVRSNTVELRIMPSPKPNR
jgi:hypothetical protein